jgi:ABC-type amino acid transport substrate-binding protein
MSKFRTTVTALALLATLPALAAPPAPAAAPVEEARCDLRVATGPRGKVYEKLFADMRQVCGTEVTLCAVPSEGGLQNLTLLSSSQADIGLAQLDTWETLKDGDDNVRKLQLVMPLHSNLLHVISLRGGSRVGATIIMERPVPGTGRVVQVRTYEDLMGLRVAAVGSAQLMSQTVARQLGLRIEVHNADSDDQALEMLNSGKVQAVFTTVGWPSPFVGRLRDDTYTLVRFEGKPPPPYQLVKRNYQNLGALNHPFLAAPNLLLSPPYKTTGSYFKRVATLQRCLAKNLDALQEGSFHPGWKEVLDPRQSYGLTLFPGTAAQTAAAPENSSRNR